MINKEYFETLDKNKQYLGLQYGDSLIAKEIIRFSKRYAPNSKEIPTHVLCFVYRPELEGWWAYESHLKGHTKLGIPSGVRRFNLDKWLQVEKKDLNQFKFVPLDIDFKELEENVGYKYGKGDIASLMLASIKNSNGKQKDRKGLICSEYLALCYPQICEYFNLPAWCITPAHFQQYLVGRMVIV